MPGSSNVKKKATGKKTVAVNKPGAANKTAARKRAAAKRMTVNGASPGKGPANRKKTAEKEPVSPFQDEIILMAALIASVLVLLSFFNICGVVGNGINFILFGSLGMAAYLFPFLLFFGAAFALSNRGFRPARVKLFSSLLLYAALMALVELAVHGYDKTQNLVDCFLESANTKAGGGILGGAISRGLCFLFGKIGACAVLIGVILVLLMLITEKFLFAGLRERRRRHKMRLAERAPQVGIENELSFGEEWEETEEPEAYGASSQKAKRPAGRRAKVVTFPKTQKALGDLSILKGYEREEDREEWDEAREPEAKEERTGNRGENIAVKDRGLGRHRNEKSGEGVPYYEKELENKFNRQEETWQTIPIIKAMEENTEDYSDTQEDRQEETEPETQRAAREGALHKTETVPSGEKNLPIEIKEEESLTEPQTVLSREEKVSSHFVSFKDGQEGTKTQEQAPKDNENFLPPEPAAAGIEAGLAEPEEAVYPESLKTEPATVRADGQNPNDLGPEKPEKVKAAVRERENAPTPLKAAEGARQEKEGADTKTGEIRSKQVPVTYELPPIHLLTPPDKNGTGDSDDLLRETAAKLKNTLDSFGVKVEMKNISCGPSVTRFELQPAQGVKVSKITNLTDDIKLSLAAADIRIEAPIPGKAAVGIEVPNKEKTMVRLRSLLESQEFKKHPSNLAFAVGKDIGGNTVVADIAKMPHLLIAGATGSGKSVCINTLIMSILYKADPSDVKLIMVDPKVVELSVYNGIPHLLIPVVTDPKKASGALNWAVAEMTDRYKKFAELGVRDIKGYNQKIKAVEDDQDERFRKMPQIVIIVDELADLMMVAPGEVEDAICRLAQLARAAGIHLVIATQRPSVNVITGLIKANVPSRVAFAVSSAVDSRTIIDGGGAEKLLGNGDMLFFPSGYPKPVRVQGSFVSDKEVSDVVDCLTEQNGAIQYDDQVAEQITQAAGNSAAPGKGADRDDYFADAARFVIEKDKASIGMLQRVYKIGFNRAARIMDQLCDAGVVGEEEGTKPRKVVMSMEQLEAYLEENG